MHTNYRCCRVKTVKIQSMEIYASKSIAEHADLVEFQVKINPGSPLQIVQGGVTLRHPAVIPRDPAPQPFPPANPNSVSAAFPLQSSQFFGNLRSSVSLPPASETTDVGASSYHNLFKREKDSSAVEAKSNESDSSAEQASSVAKRQIDEEAVSEGKPSDGKVRVHWNAHYDYYDN